MCFLMLLFNQIRKIPKWWIYYLFKLQSGRKQSKMWRKLCTIIMHLVLVIMIGNCFWSVIGCYILLVIQGEPERIIKTILFVTLTCQSYSSYNSNLSTLFQGFFPERHHPGLCMFNRTEWVHSEQHYEGQL